MKTTLSYQHTLTRMLEISDCPPSDGPGAELLQLLDTPGGNVPKQNITQLKTWQFFKKWATHTSEKIQQMHS